MAIRIRNSGLPIRSFRIGCEKEISTYGSATLTAFFNTPNFSLSAVLTCWLETVIVKVSLKFFLSQKSFMWIAAMLISDLAVRCIKVEVDELGKVK